jgi:hypothetical protein
MLDKQDGVVCTELIWLRIGTSGGSSEHGNEPWGSIKCWGLFEWLNDWRFLKDSALRVNSLVSLFATVAQTDTVHVSCQGSTLFAGGLHSSS